MLPIDEDKAGDYTCKLTVGTAASTESASSTITTTPGLSLGILHVLIFSYKHEGIRLFEQNPT